MPPRGFTNPAPKTESARSALNSFHCDLCNKSYSRHPEYEAHISSYDHQHKKRLRDLKQLSRDPNAAERARRAERKADEEAGLIVVSSAADANKTSSGGQKSTGGGLGGGFKKGGFKSSFTVVTPAPGTTAANGATSGGVMKRKNVLADEDDDDDEQPQDLQKGQTRNTTKSAEAKADAESDTDEEYGKDDLSAGGGYYDPRKPTGCFAGCPGENVVSVK
ncbi:hypothetical protein VTO42DRAFT_6940 [Malbranchea cinnamomea]